MKHDIHRLNALIGHQLREARNKPNVSVTVLARPIKHAINDLGGSILIGDKEVKFSHTAVNRDAHLFIDGMHDPILCPECIKPGTLIFKKEM